MVEWRTQKAELLLAVLTYGGAAALAVLAVVDFATRPPTPRLIEQRAGLLVLALKAVLCAAGWAPLLALFPYMRYGCARGLFLVFCGSLTLDKVLSPALVLGAIAMALGLLAAVLGLLLDLRHRGDRSSRA